MSGARIRRHKIGDCNIQERILGESCHLMLVKSSGHTCVGEESAMTIGALAGGRINVRVGGSFTMGPDAASFVAKWIGNERRQ